MKIIKTVSLVLMIYTVAIYHCFGADAKPLTKAQATQLLQLLGKQEVEVGAIVQNMNKEVGGENSATVIAISTKDGFTEKEKWTFYYDNEMGWFYSEFIDNPTRLRMWTLSGYKELPPKLTDSSATEKITGSWENDDFVLTYVKDGRYQIAQKSEVTASGTWKIQDGVLIETILATKLSNISSGTINRQKILQLNQKLLILKITATNNELVIWKRKSEQ